MFRMLSIVITLFTISLSYAQDITYYGLGETRDQYNTDILQAILEQLPDKNLNIKRYEIEMPHQRAFQRMNNGEGIDIVIGYATQERIEKYNAIELPVMKGLNGWRIALIHQDNRDIFKEVDNLDKLAMFSSGLFHSWTDTKILKANGVKVVPGSSFPGLFQMLATKRFDYFPLSLIEILPIKEKFVSDEAKVIIENNIIIRYPTCFYFYVAKSNTQLSQQLTTGFEAIIANGIFNKIFEKHHGDSLHRFMSQQRKIIQLDNPLLPKSTPINRTELWLN